MEILSLCSIMGTIKKFDCIQIWYLINSVLNKLLETSLRWKLKRSKREILLELMCDQTSMKCGFRSSRKESLLKIQKLEPDTPRQLAEKEPADQNDSNWISINWVHMISPTPHSIQRHKDNPQQLPRHPAIEKQTIRIIYQLRQEL